MRAINLRRQEQTLAVVSLHGGWLRLLEARLGPRGPQSLLSMKAKQAGPSAPLGTGLGEQELAVLLKEMVAGLPAPPKEALGLLSTGEMVTRYLTLPSENVEELRRMALFQLEGVLPFPAQECVTTIKVIGPAGEAMRVLAAAAHRPAVERLLRICSQAGLTLTGVACSSEAVGNWHRACWREAPQFPEVWLVADRSPEGLDVGVLVRGSLVYMRQVHPVTGGAEELIEQLHETLEAYRREQVGAPVQQITLSGWLEGLEPGFLERMERSLAISAHRVDPLERSPFRESLSITAQEIAPEVSFTELLGAVCAPRMLGLDLLPEEIRVGQVRERLLHEVRVFAALGSLALALAGGWIGARIGAGWWAGERLKAEIQALEPQAARVRSAAEEVRGIYQARRRFALQMELLAGGLRPLSEGMRMQFLGMEGAGLLTLRGTAPDLAAVTRYAAVLREGGRWESVQLRSAKSDPDKGSTVEFELVLEGIQR